MDLCDPDGGLFAYEITRSVALGRDGLESNSQDRCLYLLWHGTEPDGAIPGPRTPSVTQSPSCVSIGESPEAVLLIVSSQLRQTFFAFARGKQTAAGNAMSYSCPSSVRFLCTRLLFKRFCVPTQAFFCVPTRLVVLAWYRVIPLTFVDAFVDASAW